jgi:hypothetical protein
MTCIYASIERALCEPIDLSRPAFHGLAVAMQESCDCLRRRWRDRDDGLIGRGNCVASNRLLRLADGVSGLLAPDTAWASGRVRFPRM